ncbi:MAG: serine protease [Phycisphaerales bacterium]|jgi:serine protease Do|nr:serine protease [Phycisphaerales bacterium]
MKFGKIAQYLVLTAICASLAVVYLAGTGAQADRNTQTHESLHSKLNRASVEILINGRMTGSGAFVSPDGLVLTACHVLKNSKGKQIEVISPTVGRMTARQIAIDPGHDLALLQVSGKKQQYPYLNVAPDTPAALSKVLLPCGPIWRHGLILSGSIARTKPSYCWQSSLKCYTRCIYIDGASPVGSSGGCWTDSHGRIISVQSGYLNNADKAWVGIAFACPTDAIHKLIARKTDRELATLGATVDELWTQSQGFIARLPKGAQGIVTPRIQKGGPSEQAGLTSETLIMEIDGKPVAYLEDLLDIVQSKKPGDEVTLKVIEPIGKPARLVKVRLGKVN